MEEVLILSGESEMGQYQVWKALKDSGEPLLYAELKKRVRVSPSDALIKLVRAGFVQRVPKQRNDRRSTMAYQAVDGLDMEPPIVVEI